MIAQVKKMARVVLPEALIRKSADTWNAIRYKRALQAFNDSGTSPEYLSAEKLPELFRKFSFVSTYHYDPDSIRERGVERASAILKLDSALPGKRRDFLELGCGDGMVSGILQEKGMTCTAIDFYDGGFDERARQAGVVFHKMDAAYMQLPDQSFDFVFSYNAFEHFPQPDRVFSETLRVLRPGGYVYIEFSPLFNSSYGMHAYKSIPVPYCHHLFRIEDMEAFILKHKLEPVNFTNHANGWTLEQFRNLWKSKTGMVDVIEYNEIRTFGDLSLVAKYPSCFKSKTPSLDEFIVSGIRALFRKK